MLNFSEETSKNYIYTNDAKIKRYVDSHVFEVKGLQQGQKFIHADMNSLNILIVNTEKPLHIDPAEDFNYVIKYGVCREKTIDSEIYLPNQEALQGLLRILSGYINEDALHPIGTEMEEHIMYVLKHSNMKHKYLRFNTEDEYLKNIREFIDNTEITNNSKALVALRYGTEEDGGLFWLSKIGEYVNELMEEKAKTKIDFIYFPFSHGKDEDKAGIIEMDIFITRV